MRLLLKRVDPKPEMTKGELVLSPGLKLHTLELPWKNNVANESCISYGKYTCKRVSSPKFGNTFEVLNVPNRSNILFHSGNRVSTDPGLTDSHGCILLGMRRSATGILESKRAVEMFLEHLKNETEFELEIR